MEIITALFIGLGLSMDSFAVSLGCAAACDNPSFKQWLLVALPFTLIQPSLALIGWFAGEGMRFFIGELDHWIAFLLLLMIGCKMIYGSTKSRASEKNILELKPALLITLAVATSIDAFAVGIGLGFIDAPLLLTVAAIAAITFFMVMTGGFVGKNFAKFFKRYAETAGGVMLMLIGLKILVEHILKGI